MLELVSLQFYQSIFSTLRKQLLSPDSLFCTAKFVHLDTVPKAAVWDETYNCVVQCSSVFCVHIGLLVKKYNFAQVTHVRNCTFFKTCK